VVLHQRCDRGKSLAQLRDRRTFIPFQTEGLRDSKQNVYSFRGSLTYFSWGFILDLVECLIQRDFDYTTRDVRAAYAHIKDALLEDQMERVVVIAHSQGGIILSMVLDNLLADLPRECKASFITVLRIRN
jgi:hypothetical protein